MSSFHKVFKASTNLTGTKVKNNLCFVSSGIPSLDHIIGGGLPTGAIFAVEEDTLGTYSRTLCKYFLAEGITCKHNLLVASADDDTKEFVNELPQSCDVPIVDEINTTSNDMDKMKIAWRYEGLGQVESSFGANTNFGHHFDLSKYIHRETINNSNIIHWTSKESAGNTAAGFKNNLYYQLLKFIQQEVQKEEYQLNSNKKSILRINIQSLGSPIWLAEDCEDDLHSFGQDLIKFMFCLRSILRDTYAVAFITIPSHLFDEPLLMNRILYSIDNAVKIESFAGSSRETNPVYKDYHGLFHVTKLSAIYTLVPFVPPSLDLAFKLRRKKFVIEKLHLPPELQESSEREQDDITAVPNAANCGGFKKKDIEF